MSARARRPRVLHVDDDQGVRRALERILVAAGFTVVSAADGAEGLALARRGRWALLVLDVDLPGMSGFELCARLRAEPATRTVPVLHLSAARVDVRDRVRGLEGGADAYLVQPVSPEELVAVARALLARAARGRTLPPQARAHARGAAAAREAGVGLVGQVLRAPLSAISINAQSLAAAAGDPVARARAGAVLEAHAAAAQALADLEELTWLETSRAPLPLEHRSARDVVAAAAQRVAAAADAAGVRLEVGATATLALRCDPGRLERALEALVRRALRGASRGGAVGLSAAVAGEVVRFSVLAEGGATGEDGRAQLLDAVWDSKVARNGPELVTLALARAIVLAHGGRIAVDPVSATVHLDLPAVPLSLTPP